MCPGWFVSCPQDVIEIHAWDQQILHVLAPTAAAADLLRDAYAQMDAETKDNTVVLVTVTDNADWVYTNGAPGNNNGRPCSLNSGRWLLCPGDPLSVEPHSSLSGAQLVLPSVALPPALPRPRPPRP